ncbi:MAG: DNA recombination protein RmuC [Bacteroidia bacterium]|nr:DNA recombination protein RmuC [Bacteroidia bacterium]
MNVLYLIIGLLIGSVATWFIAKFKFKSESQGNTPQDFDKIIELNRSLATKSTEVDNLTSKLQDQKKEIEELHENLKTQFENLANKILEEKSQKFTTQNKENIKQILEPLGVKIKEFEKKVEDKYIKEAEGRSALAQQIRTFADLNKQMSEDANNLTKALKGDSKAQGNWGELRLELLLEKAGLIKNIHYKTQESFRDDDKNLKKPDFIIKLPDNHHIVVDSKVSLVAYESYFNVEDEAEKERSLKEHINSIKNHIRDLSSKNYQNLYEINTPDYVLMFIPIEPAFIIAVQADEQLYLEALDKNVVLVTTSTLLATMSTISSIWKQEDQKKHVLEIARQSGALYDKFVGFAEDLIDVGRRMNSAKTSYDAAMNKLSEGSGNLVRRAETIKKLGAKASKSLPQGLLDRAEVENSDQLPVDGSLDQE